SLVALDLGFKVLWCEDNECYSRLYGDEAMILKESLMMLLVSNMMEFGVDVTDNNRIWEATYAKDINLRFTKATYAIWYDRIRVLLTLLLGSKYLFKYCCAGWIKISVEFHRCVFLSYLLAGGNLFVLKWCDEDLSKSSKVSHYRENEDFVKNRSDHYMEPTEFEIQEMVNILFR
ncbi:hypothetical protein Tco_1252930, partial [Tanacetum coccineum]